MNILSQMYPCPVLGGNEDLKMGFSLLLLCSATEGVGTAAAVCLSVRPSHTLRAKMECFRRMVTVDH